MFVGEDSKQKKLRFLLWIMTLFQMTMITSFSSQPASVSAEGSRHIVDIVVETVEEICNTEFSKSTVNSLHRGIRKFAHFMIFFTMGFILCMLGSEYCREDARRVFLFALICGLFLATTDEIHQLFVPGRSAEIRDVCIDFLGNLSGSVIFFISKRVFGCLSV